MSSQHSTEEQNLFAASKHHHCADAVQADLYKEHHMPRLEAERRQSGFAVQIGDSCCLSGRHSDLVILLNQGAISELLDDLQGPGGTLC